MQANAALCDGQHRIPHLLLSPVATGDIRGRLEHIGHGIEEARAMWPLPFLQYQGYIYKGAVEFAVKFCRPLESIVIPVLFMYT